MAVQDKLYRVLPFFVCPSNVVCKKNIQDSVQDKK